MTAFDVGNILNDVLTQIAQMKLEMIQNVGDVMSRIDQLRLQVRGDIGTISSQMNLIRSEVRSCAGEVRTCASQVAAVRQETTTVFNTLTSKAESGQQVHTTTVSKEEHHRNSRADVQMTILEDTITRGKSNSYIIPTTQNEYSTAVTSTPMYIHQVTGRDGRSTDNGNDDPCVISYVTTVEDDENSLGQEQNNMVMMQSSMNNNHYPTPNKRPASSPADNMNHKRSAMRNVHQQSQMMSQPVEQTVPDYTDVDITENGMVKIGPYLEIPCSAYESFVGESRTIYLRKMLDLVFGTEMLATHTLGGRSTDRPPLDEDIVNDIVAHISRKFSVEENCVKKYISDRCYHEFKKRMLDPNRETVMT